MTLVSAAAGYTCCCSNTTCYDQHLLMLSAPAALLSVSAPPAPPVLLLDPTALLSTPPADAVRAHCAVNSRPRRPLCCCQAPSLVPAPAPNVILALTWLLVLAGRVQMSAKHPWPAHHIPEKQAAAVLVKDQPTLGAAWGGIQGTCTAACTKAA